MLGVQWIFLHIFPILKPLFFFLYLFTLLQFSQFFPLCHPPPKPTPNFHSQFPHCCPCLWVIHTCSFSNPFPFSLSTILTLPHPLSVVSLFPISTSLVLFCLLVYFVHHIPLISKIIWYLPLNYLLYFPFWGIPHCMGCLPPTKNIKWTRPSSPPFPLSVWHQLNGKVMGRIMQVYPVRAGNRSRKSMGTENWLGSVCQAWYLHSCLSPDEMPCCNSYKDAVGTDNSCGHSYLTPSPGFYIQMCLHVHLICVSTWMDRFCSITFDVIPTAQPSGIPGSCHFSTLTLINVVRSHNNLVNFTLAENRQN